MAKIAGKLEGNMVEQSVEKPGSYGPNYKQVRGDFRNRVLVWRQPRSRVGLLLGLAFFASASSAWADAIGNLQGSWVTEDSKCTAVFEKIAGKVRFKALNLAQSGFVISGKKVSGPIAGCTISQVKEENDRFSALLTCADSAVSKKLSMTFRLIDATHFERLNVYGDLTITYKKCSF